MALAPEGFAPEVAARWRGDDGEVPPDTLAWPATWMNLEEARAIAEWRGMRLPTTREWIFVAVGYSKLPYPWGLSAQASFCNTRELSLDRLVPVGTFESGQAPTYGLHDLMGNAMEWVADWVPGYGDYREQEPADFHPERGLTRAGEVSAMGGSYKERLRPTYDDWIRAEWLAFQADTLAPGHRAEDLGFRCVADAREYLWAHADRWGATAEARERVAAVARGWAAAVGPREVERLLEELAARDGAPPGIAWLLEGVP